jgi:hypothetical protein
MASTKAPLFGLDASGTLGKSIVFSKWRGRTYVRRHTIPKNPKSGLQIGMRACLKFLTQAWAGFGATVQDDWATLAAPDNITYLNAAVRDGQARSRMNLGMRRSPDDAAGTTPSAPTIDSVTAQPKSLVIAWTAGANAPQLAWRIHRSLTGTFTRDISNLVAVVAAADASYTDTGLTTGTEYFYEITGQNNDGELGAASTENSGTPT